MGMEYWMVQQEALIALRETKEKLLSGEKLTTAEGAWVLNTHWSLYLHAVSLGRITEASEANNFVLGVERYLRLCGYLVTFTEDHFAVV